MLVVVLVAFSARDECCWHELHPTLGAAVRVVAGDLGMHWAGIAARRRGGQEFHAALRAFAGTLAYHVGVQRAAVDEPLSRFEARGFHVHLGNEGKCLVRLGLEFAFEPARSSANSGFVRVWAN